MIASASDVRPGYVRDSLSIATLRDILSGVSNVEATHALGINGAEPYVHHSRLPSGTLVGFIASHEQPREITVARLPFNQPMIPAVTLRPARRYWEPDPQLMSKNFLLRDEGIVLKADWLDYLVDLAEALAKSKSPLLGIDKTSLAIGAAWEWWEKENLPWLDRCRDLARITHSSEPTPNTLLTICKRGGLVRRDKNAD